MERGKLTIEEQRILKENKYVLDVNEAAIIYTNEFKFHFMKEYLKGEKPTKILQMPDLTSRCWAASGSSGLPQGGRSLIRRARWARNMCFLERLLKRAQGTTCIKTNPKSRRCL